MTTMLRINPYGDIEFNHASATLSSLPPTERRTAEIVLEWQRKWSNSMFKLDYFVGQLTWCVEFLTDDISIPYGIAAKLRANVEMLSSPDGRHHVLVILQTHGTTLLTDRDRFAVVLQPYIQHGLHVT